MLEFMRDEIDPYYIEALRKYYEASNDVESKIVDFTSSAMSDFLGGDVEITYGKENFLIMDRFSNVQPIVFSHESLVKKREQMPFIAGILLDSQVVAYLHQFLTDKGVKFKNTPRGIATYRLLKELARFSKLGWDINSSFYFTEAMAKNTFAEAFPYANRFADTMLKINTMDSSAFLDRDEVVPDPAKMQEYHFRHSGKPFSEVSVNNVKAFSDERLHRDLGRHVDAIYASILKIAILQQKAWNYDIKFRRLFEFFQNEIGAYSPYLTIVGALHFAGKAGRFIPLQKGAKNVRQKLLASAWDLLFLRLPEIIIANEGSRYTSIYYVCTAEKALQHLGRIVKIKRASSLPYLDGTVPALIGVNSDILKLELGYEIYGAFLLEQKSFFDKRSSTRPKSQTEIASLIDRLEAEAAEIAGGELACSDSS